MPTRETLETTRVARRAASPIPSTFKFLMVPISHYVIKLLLHLFSEAQFVNIRTVEGVFPMRKKTIKLNSWIKFKNDISQMMA